jgi:hypothetical protein
MKTARFADVVKTGGAPETYLLWTPPAQDKAFQRALKEHRILTVHQEIRGTKKDFGEVGFAEAPNAQYLVFPKSLRRFADRRIIGINYDLMAKDSRPATEKVKASKPPKVPKKTKAPPPPKPVAIPRSVEKKDNIVPFSGGDREEISADDQTESAPEKALEKPTPAPRKQAVGKSVEIQMAKAPSNRKLVAELEKVMKQLRAGKSVIAYQQLERVVEGLRSVET